MVEAQANSENDVQQGCLIAVAIGDDQLSAMTFGDSTVRLTVSKLLSILVYVSLARKALE